jgi:HSP20 family protein
MATENRGEATQGNEKPQGTERQTSGRQQGPDRSAASVRSGVQGETRGERSTRGENERSTSRRTGGGERLARVEDEREGGGTGGLRRGGGDFLSLFRTVPLPIGPLGLMRRMVQNVDRLLDDIGGFSRWSQGREGLWSPQIEMFEQGDEIVVRADLPGLEEKDINAEIVGDTLIIEGERRSEIEETRRGVHRSERTYGRFRRAIPLPGGVDAESAKANFENGVLEVRLRAPGRTEPSRKIEVKSRRAQSNESPNPSVH